jgi:tetratricopeptide (TPR) repeat protein
MNRTILAGALALVTCAAGLMAQAQPPQQKGPAPKSPKELEALQALFGAQDPDARIKAGEELITKFADTEFKGTALYLIAASYDQKNDFEKTIVWGERALEADPKNFSTMNMLAGAIAKNSKDTDLDLEEKLGRAEKYAKTAAETVATAEKPNPQLTDEQWAAAKQDIVAQSHEVLGMSAMLRKKYDAAITEFKTSIEKSASQDQTTSIRLARAYTASGKHDDAIALLDKLMADPATPAQVKQFAQADRVRAIQAKGGGAPATKK